MTSQLSLSKALAQLEHVFITSKTWKHLGGLPGLCLSVRGAGRFRYLTLCQSPGTDLSML